MRSIANVDFNTAVFSDWLDKTNQLLYAMSNEVVTANSTWGITNGNCVINGSIASNTVIVSTTLRGGNTTTSQPLSVTSNLNISNNVTVSGTTDSTILKTNSTYFVGNTSSISGTVATLIDSFPKSQGKSAKYFITASTNTSTQSMETLAVHDGTSIFMTKYAELVTNTVLVTVDAIINGANVEIKATPLVNATYTITTSRLHQ